MITSAKNATSLYAVRPGSENLIWLKPWAKKPVGGAFRCCSSTPTKCCNICTAVGADDSLERRLKTYLRPDLLILDDFGLKPLQAPAPTDLYDVINERYERGSILLTSNRPPGEWPGLFGDPLLAAAGIDRLAHRAEIIIIRGDSFRAQSRKRLEQEADLN